MATTTINGQTFETGAHVGDVHANIDDLNIAIGEFAAGVQSKPATVGVVATAGSAVKRLAAVTVPAATSLIWLRPVKDASWPDC